VTRGLSVAVGIAAALAVAIPGCGPGPGPGSADVSVTVTRDFGARQVRAITESRAPGSETVMELLERHLRIGARYGGDFVESIDGLSGSSSHLDWFYYVNGVQAPQGAGTTAVHRGDRIWWDLHDWTTTDSIPAVVGSFPEPFLDGVGGRRYPTTLECAPDARQACAEADHALVGLGIRVERRSLRGGSGGGTIEIVVGTFGELTHVSAARLVAGGPKSSGVYARVAAGGRRLLLLDPHDQVARTLAAGAGLVAATAAGNGAVPTWVITGTDVAGVDAAAGALSSGRLDDHFALAVEDGQYLPLPLDPSS